MRVLTPAASCRRRRCRCSVRSDAPAGLNLVATRGSNEQTRLRVLREGVGSVRIAMDIAMVRVKENHAVKETDAENDGAGQREPV